MHLPPCAQGRTPSGCQHADCRGQLCYLFLPSSPGPQGASCQSRTVVSWSGTRPLGSGRTRRPLGVSLPSLKLWVIPWAVSQARWWCCGGGDWGKLQAILRIAQLLRMLASSQHCCLCVHICPHCQLSPTPLSPSPHCSLAPVTALPSLEGFKATGRSQVIGDMMPHPCVPPPWPAERGQAQLGLGVSGWPCAWHVELLGSF